MLTFKGKQHLNKSDFQNVQSIDGILIELRHLHGVFYSGRGRKIRTLTSKQHKRLTA